MQNTKTRSVTEEMARGAAWMFAARGIDKSLGTITTVVLARLLVPDDFGVVAIATAITALLALLTSFSFDVVLIQHPSPTRAHYDTVWTLNLAFSAALALIFCAIAKPMAWFYDEPRLFAVMIALGGAALIGSLANIGCVNFRRELRFRKEFQLGLIRRLASLPVVIALAFTLHNHWALVLGSIATTTIGVAVSYMMHPFRPRLSLACKEELFGYSKWLFLNNLVIFVNSRAGDFIIGRMRGAHDLGLFTIANEVGSLPTTELVAPINRAAFPGYSRLAGDHRELTQTYLRVMGMIALVALPVAVGIGLTAPLFVPLLFGLKWVDAIPLVILLALASALVSIWSNTGYVFLAIGKPRKVTLLLGVHAIFTVSFLIGFLWLRVPNGVGWAMLATATTAAIPNLYLWRSELGIPWQAAWVNLWRPIIGCMLMAAGVLSLQSMTSTPKTLGGEVATLALSVLTGAVIFVATVLTAWWAGGKPNGAESFAIARLQALRRRFK